jgi:hypothetical protein
MSFSFIFQKPSLWTGRLGLPAAGEGVFCLRHSTRGFWPHLLWGTSHIQALSSVPVYGLVDAILEARAFARGQANLPAEHPGDLGSASFLLNEFGQVLVPASADSHVAALAGECDGSLDFARIQEGAVQVLDLSREGELEPGDLWPHPALGLPYHLSRRTHVYFQDYDGKQEEPAEQDWELIDGLRKLCPSGPMRFLVNPWGIVQWKRGEDWIYAGKIRKETWFEKEEGKD